MIIRAKQLEFHTAFTAKCKFKYYVSFHCLMSRLYWFAMFLNTLLFPTVQRQLLYFSTHSKETLTRMTVLNNEHRRQCGNLSTAYLREHSPSRQFYTHIKLIINQKHGFKILKASIWYPILSHPFPFSQ
jgi:hypothetical protein